MVKYCWAICLICFDLGVRVKTKIKYTLFCSGLLFFCLKTSVCFSGQGLDIVDIKKDVSDNAPTIKVPDTDGKYYKTINGTHYSYRCDVIHMLKSKQSDVEICEINPVMMDINDWPETEVIHLIKGSVLIVNQDNVTKKYQTGDMFILPEGFKGKWIQSEKIVKLIVRHPLYWKD